MADACPPHDELSPLEREIWAAAYVLRGDCLEVLKTIPDCSISAVVTDPPYGLSREPDMADVVRHWCAEELREHAARTIGAAAALAVFPAENYTHGGGGFMGKSWDSFVPGPEVWREVWRVLKPGGHMLVFSGTRTYDLTVLAIRLAGFEIRDQLAWMYGSGFPKSLDVSKAIDKINGEAGRLYKFTEWMRTTGLTARQIDDATKTNMGGHYLTDKTQPAIPTRHLWVKLRPLCGEVPAWVDDLVERIEAEREVVGQHKTTSPGCSMRVGMTGCEQDDIGNITAPATDAARRWSGWGTALKPAQEPIVLARKPLVGTVAANVLAHGTGGINVDGCRIGSEGGGKCRGHQNAGQSTSGETFHGSDTSGGRWPANVLLDETAAAMLDERKNGAFKSVAKGAETPRQSFGFADAGGASRFFYVAKASRAEREAGLDHLPMRSGGELTDREDDSEDLNSPRAGAGRGGGRRNHHPTVKPVALMRHLVRIITPPGGVVLDPYAGSGSTLCAAVLEGMASIGIEITPEYVPIIEGRIEAARTSPHLFDPEEPEPEERNPQQTELFG